MKCINCDGETLNPKFCGKSCAASTNNKLFVKRKMDRKCLDCDDLCWTYRHKRCQKHLELYKQRQAASWKTKTVGEYRALIASKNMHQSSTHVHIRGYAKTWFKELRKEPCRFCGYSKFVELAHIKAVSSFPDSALLSEINSLENLLPLCPTCHWEFDNLPEDQWSHRQGLNLQPIP